MQRTKEILWRERINQVDSWEKEDMDLDPGWKTKAVENLLREEELKEEKKYLLELSFQNGQF